MDPFQYFGGIDTGRIANASTVGVGHIRVDAQHNICVAEQVRTARVAEAGTARAAARVERQFQELIAVDEISRDQFTRRVETDSQPGPGGRSSTASLFLYSVTDEVHGSLVLQ